MTHDSFSRKRSLWLIPPVVIGIVIFIAFKSVQQPPQPSEVGEIARSVRTLQIHKTDFVPIAQGYGLVQPAQVWKAIAEVSGRIIEMHPRLENGEVIEQGETLFQIDPVDYELNLAQAKSHLAELDVQQANTEASLKIEKKNLALAKKEHARLQKLAKKGSISQSNVDSAERTMHSSSALVQNLNNSLALLPTQRNLQLAKITQSERDLASATVIAPFNLRVSSMSIEADQYVTKGQHMFSGDSVNRVEIIAQIALSSLKNLFIDHPDTPKEINFFANNLSSFTGFKPTITLDMGQGQTASWQATFIRFTDGVDTQTRTIGVVVAVDNPMQKIIPGVRPPLTKGMFVEVAIAGHTQTDKIVIPRSALRNGKVYILDAQNRLQIRTVNKLYDQQDKSIIGEGLDDGEQLVLTDLIPAIQGMLLKPGNDLPTEN
jgi:RND family efflux transporter MFP subunit